MFCSQCGRQVPDGSRYCNYCGHAIAVNDMNPDEKPEQEHYQDYGAFDAPKGFETLPYNKHGYGRETTNFQQTQVPLGGFIQKDYTQQPRLPQGGSFQQGYNANGQPQQPWQQDFATRPVRRKKKWLLPVIIGAAVLILAIAALLLFSCRSDEKTVNTEDTMLQANLSNWGHACMIGKNYYVFIRDLGLLKVKEANLTEDPSMAPDPEVIVPVPTDIDGLESYDIQDMVPVGNWLYYQVYRYYSNNKATYCYHAYDTVKGTDYELFTETGDFCYTLDLVDDRIYYCLEGNIFYIDTKVDPGSVKECRGDTGLRLGDDPTIAVCPQGFLISERGDKGLKLISFENETIRTYDKLSDRTAVVYFVKDGLAYYRLTDADDPYTFYRLNIVTGESTLFVKQVDLYDPFLVRLTFYEDWFYFGITFKDRNGECCHGIVRVDKDGEPYSITNLDHLVYGENYSLVCMVITGKYMIVRLPLIPEAPMGIFTVPDMRKTQ